MEESSLFKIPTILWNLAPQNKSYYHYNYDKIYYNIYRNDHLYELCEGLNLKIKVS